MARNSANQWLADVAPNDVSAERQWETGLVEPPFAQIGHQLESAIAIGELALVDQEPDVYGSVGDGVLYTIKGSENRLELRLEETQREICTRQQAGNRDALAPHVGRTHGRPRDEPRAVSIAHRRAVREQGISVRQIRVRVNRDCRDFELRAQCSLVQRLDVLQFMDITQIARVDLAFGERVEHERVIGIGAMSNVDGS